MNETANNLLERVLEFTRELTIIGAEDGFFVAKNYLRKFRTEFKNGFGDPTNIHRLKECELFHKFHITGFEGANFSDSLHALENCIESEIFADEQLISFAKLAVAFERDRDKSNIVSMKQEILRAFSNYPYVSIDTNRLRKEMDEVKGCDI
jgi:hypothetical protein